jgi:hypothetical protein
MDSTPSEQSLVVNTHTDKLVMTTLPDYLPDD